MENSLYDNLTKGLYKIQVFEPTYEISPEQIASGSFLASFNQVMNVFQSGKTKFDNSEVGYILGLDAGMPKFYIGDSSNYLNWDGSNVAISGALTVSSGAIGGFDIGADYMRDTANSFGLSSTVTGGDDVRFWAGDTFANRTTAPFRVTEAGVVTASDLTITGGSVATSVLSGIIAQSNLNIADRGWTQTSVFSVTDADTVAWGAGTFTSADGTAYSINAGNTGNMAAKTYVYLDTAVSTTVYQTTTTATTAVGAGKVLIATAQNGTGEATYEVLQSQGGRNIDAANIVTGSITANEIAASTITAGKLSVSQLDAITVNMGTLTAGTINGGTIIGNVKFGAGDLLFASADTMRYIDSYTSYTKMKAITVNRGGTLRIKFYLEAANSADASAYGKIYRNDVAVGTERIQGDDTNGTWSEDITGWSAGDSVQLYAKVGQAGSGTSNVANFRIYIDNQDTYTVVTD